MKVFFITPNHFKASQRSFSIIPHIEIYWSSSYCGIGFGWLFWEILGWLFWGDDNGNKIWNIIKTT